MSIEIAFLLGILIGQWLMFWAMWRNITNLERKTQAWNADLHPTGSPADNMPSLLPESLPDDEIF
jgi:hypothetical protein